MLQSRVTGLSKGGGTGGGYKSLRLLPVVFELDGSEQDLNKIQMTRWWLIMELLRSMACLSIAFHLARGHLKLWLLNWLTDWPWDLRVPSSELVLTEIKKHEIYFMPSNLNTRSWHHFNSVRVNSCISLTFVSREFWQTSHGQTDYEELTPHGVA